VTAAPRPLRLPRVRRRPLLHGLVGGILAWLVTGCASRHRPAVDLISGRLSLRVAEDTRQQPARPAQNLAAGFELQGDATRGELRLASSFGTLLALARWAPEQVSLRTADGERTFSDLDSLSQVVLGEAVPLAALPDWMAGRPWDGAPHVLLENGFEQAGWLVNTSRKAEGRIEAQRVAAPQAQLRVQLNTAP
jgi:outer membrane lipoprotein LolB